MMNSEGCKCEACFGVFKLDLLINDELWKLINPTDELKMICGPCILRLMEDKVGFAAYRLVDVDRIRELEQENATLRNAKCLKCGKSLAPDGDCYACECDRLHLQLASAIDMANTCCREHGLRESNNVKPGIERLAWKCTELRQQIARTEEG